MASVMATAMASGAQMRAGIPAKVFLSIVAGAIMVNLSLSEPGRISFARDHAARPGYCNTTARYLRRMSFFTPLTPEVA